MHIYIDESGVFKVAQNIDAWCVVAAIAAPEPTVRRLAPLLLPYKLACGKRYDEEVKLGELSDAQAMSFLDGLSKLDCTVYCVATEMSLVTEAQALEHKEVQAEMITHHIEKMNHAGARAGLRAIADDVRALSPQLYMQLICQVLLIKEVIDRAILYHVQRSPKCLGSFKWRIDQKNTTMSIFESVFAKIAPSLLQSMALTEPLHFCTDFDYSAMHDFLYTEENAPKYIRDTYGFNFDPVGGLNVGKILRSDLQFPGSHTEPGLQVVDLVASSIGRVLRGRFLDEPRAAEGIGKLMVQGLRGRFPIRLVSFGDADADVSDRVARIMRGFASASKPMLAK